MHAHPDRYETGCLISSAPTLPLLLSAAWMARQAACGQVPCSPATNQPLPSRQLLPNHSMRAVISSLRDSGQLD